MLPSMSPSMSNNVVIPGVPGGFQSQVPLSPAQLPMMGRRTATRINPGTVSTPLAAGYYPPSMYYSSWVKLKLRLDNKYTYIIF